MYEDDTPQDRLYEKSNLTQVLFLTMKEDTTHSAAEIKRERLRQSWGQFPHLQLAHHHREDRRDREERAGGDREKRAGRRRDREERAGGTVKRGQEGQ